MTKILHCLYCANELDFNKTKYCNRKHAYMHRKYGLPKAETEDIDNYEKEIKELDKKLTKSLKAREKAGLDVVKFKKVGNKKIKAVRSKLKKDIQYQRKLDIQRNWKNTAAAKRVSMFKTSSMGALRELIGLKDIARETIEPEVFIIKGDKTYVEKNKKRRRH